MQIPVQVRGRGRGGFNLQDWCTQDQLGVSAGACADTGAGDGAPFRAAGSSASLSSRHDPVQVQEVVLWVW